MWYLPMNKNYSTALTMFFLMLATSVLAAWFKPTTLLSNIRPAVVFESAIPKKFGDWVEDEKAKSGLVNPQATTLVNKLYSQVISRAYVNNVTHDRIMLSVAYGGDQSDSLQLHLPDFCYPAQGFQVITSQATHIDTGFGKIQAHKLITAQGARVEPVVYWVVVGDKITQGGFSSKLAQMGYGFRGIIPDGLIFRTSSISDQPLTAFSLQQQFIADLLRSLPADVRHRLVPTSI